VINLNFIEVYQKITDDMNLLIENKLKNSKRDRSFKAKVIEKLSDGKYRIQYKNQSYTARCPATLEPNDTVYVCAPENDWTELFINLPCTRKEHEALAANTLKQITHSSSISIKTTGGTAYTFALPSDCSTLISLTIKQAWPKTTWNNGALVSLCNVSTSGTNVTVTLSTNTEQEYQVSFYVIYK